MPDWFGSIGIDFKGIATTIIGAIIGAFVKWLLDL